MALTYLGDAAKCPARRDARLFLRHSLPNEAGLEVVQMRGDFTLELAIGPTSLHRGEEPRDESAESRHNRSLIHVPHRDTASTCLSSGAVGVPRHEPGSSRLPGPHMPSAIDGARAVAESA
jgi:hypothetical protein